MKLKKLLLLIVIFIVFSLMSCNVSSSGQLTLREKIQDFQYLYEIIEENYPFLQANKRKNSIDWSNKKMEYLDKIKNTTSDEEFLNALESILKELNNDNTKMIVGEEINYYFSLYANNTEPSPWLDILNNPLVLKRYENFIQYESTYSEETKINNDNNVVTKDIVNGKIAYISITDMLDIKYMDKDIQILDSYLNLIKDYNSLVIDIRGNNGGTNDYWQYYLLPKITRIPLSSITYSFLRDGSIIRSLCELANVSEIEVKNIENLDKSKLTNLPWEVYDDFKYYEKFETKVYPRDSVGFKGRVYLLVDSNTKGAAESLAIFSKQSKFATLIGEPTGGGGIEADPILLMLPNSGYIFSMAKELVTIEDGTSNEESTISPHYIIENSLKSTDFTSDSCIAKVFELEGLNIDDTLSITNKEFPFVDSIDNLQGYNEDELNNIYEFIGDLLSNYNGEITAFGPSDKIRYKFEKQYDTKEIVSLTYTKPSKISIQSKSSIIPSEYRDRFLNVSLEITEIRFACIDKENRIIIELSGSNDGIILEFYDNILTNELLNLISKYK